MILGLMQQLIKRHIHTKADSHFTPPLISKIWSPTAKKTDFKKHFITHICVQKQQANSSLKTLKCKASMKARPAKYLS